MTVCEAMDEIEATFGGDVEMNSCCLRDLVIITNTRGAVGAAKDAYPVRYGLYHEIRSREFAFFFNPTGEIRYIRGLTQAWPHPWEWLKRTFGNDWVYYSAGLDRELGRVREWVGEDYLPCLSYESNAIWQVTPYSDPRIATAFSAWSQVYGTLCSSPLSELPEDIKTFICNVIRTNEESALIDKTAALHGIIGGRVTVLPPDTRHVDYEVIPLNIADGCLYRCRFCSVKSDVRFRPRSRENITDQIEALKAFYGSTIQNLNAIFIGNHDALAAGVDLILFAAEKAYEAFGFQRPQGGIPSLFLFGSADSFLNTQESLFERLNSLPFKVYINLGLESYDEATLKGLGKPITPDMVYDALHKMVQINERFDHLEVSANFLLGTSFSTAHRDSLITLLGDIPKGKGMRGYIYLSPLVESLCRHQILPMFQEIKRESTLPTYAYLIQRL